jgi:hypothetical protein
VKVKIRTVPYTTEQTRAILDEGFANLKPLEVRPRNLDPPATARDALSEWKEIARLPAERSATLTDAEQSRAWEAYVDQKIEAKVQPLYALIEETADGSVRFANEIVKCWIV